MLTLNQNQQDINLGNITLGKPYKINYTLNNTSDKTVNITALTVGCGSCTTAETSDSSIQAGQSGVVKVVFTPNATGINSKLVTVFYKVGEDQQEPLVIKFKANVE